MQREEHVRTQGEDGRLHSKERGPEGTSPANILVLDVQPPGLSGFSVTEAAPSAVLRNGCLSRLHQPPHFSLHLVMH